MGAAKGADSELEACATLRNGRWWSVPFAGFCGIVLSLLAFSISCKSALDSREKAFSELVAPSIQRFEDLLRERVSDLDSTARFYESSDVVTKEEFETYVSPLLRSKRDVLLAAWIPLVSENERAKFEKAVRAEGLREFSIHEKTLNGANAPAAKNEFHAPYLHLWPEEGNAGMAGFDLWTEPLRRSLLETARDNGECVASNRLNLLQDSSGAGSSGVILCAPVYSKGSEPKSVEERRERIRGFLFMVIRPNELLEQIKFKGVGRSVEFKLDVQLSKRAERQKSPEGIFCEKSMHLAGREFILDCVPLKAFYSDNPIVVPWLILAICMILTASVTIFFALSELRTASLAKALQRGVAPPELREASAIRMKIVIAVAIAMALMLVWFLLWTHRELASVGALASNQTANQVAGLWRNLAAQDSDSLREAFAEALSDETLVSAWRSKDRVKTLKALAALASRNRLSGEGDSILLAGLDRRCIARSDKPNAYGELIESKMLLDSIREGRALCGVDIDADGALKTRLAAPFASSSGTLGFIVMTKSASTYPENVRRIAGCELFEIVFKNGVDERLWKAAGREANGSTYAWEDFPDFVAVEQGSLSSKAVLSAVSEFAAKGWGSVIETEAGRESWFCVSRPIEDYAEREIGRMVVLRDASGELSTQRKTLAMTLAGTGALAVSLVIAISSLAGAMERRLLSSVLAREMEEEELHALQERLASTLHSIGDAVISTDVEGRVTDLNAVAETLTGWSRDDAKGRRIEAIFNLINASTRQKAELPVEKVLREGRVVGLANHSAIISKSGVETQIADSAAPIKSASGAIIGAVLVFRDVSDDYRIREELGKSEARFRLLAENSKDVIYLLDAPSGKIQYISPSAKSVSGYQPEEFYANAELLRSIVHKDDVKIFSSAMASAVSGHPGPSAEFRVIRKDGRIVWVSTRSSVSRDAAGRVVSIQGVATEISAKKTMEEALRKSEELYRTLVNNIDMGIVLIDSDRRIIMVNKEISNRYGKDISHFIGRKCNEVFESRTSICPHCPGMQALATGLSAEDEFDFVKPDGAKRRMRNRALPVKDKDGTIVSFIEITMDVTETKKAEERKLHLEQQLLQSQKMESVGRLAGGIAHDFNNMLTPILGYADMLLKKLGSDEKTRAKLEQIINAATRARDLTRQLLAMGRKQTMQMRQLDINAVISNFERMLRRTIREDIAIELTLAPSLPSIYGDPGQIEQIILNLAVNAQDAMANGGLLKISSSETLVDERMAHMKDGAQPGPYVTLTVSDSGTGMDQELINKIFEPFFTTKPQGRGTGLGLSTVYGIVKQHGGFIDVRSKPGSGSAFMIHFPKSGPPLSVPAIEPAPAAATNEPPVAGGHECILIAEDQENVRDMVSEVLRAKGYFVISAADGIKALEASSNYQGKIDLLLSDIVMPGLNGKALYERIAQARRNSLKVLFMSGYTNNLIGEELQADAGVDFIQKPFTIDKLLLKIRNMLDGVKDAEAPASEESKPA